LLSRVGDHYSAIIGGIYGNPVKTLEKTVSFHFRLIGPSLPLNDLASQDQHVI